MSWKELVLVEAHYFKQGEYPWTRDEFYCHSQLQREANLTVNPIVITLHDFDGPRVAEDDCWWDELGDLWSSDINQPSGYYQNHIVPIGDDWKLEQDVIRLNLTPLDIGIWITEDFSIPHESLISYEIDNMGKSDVFWSHLRDIVKMSDWYRNKHDKPDLVSDVQFLTIWECDSGIHSSLDGDDYYTDYELVGSITIDKNSIIINTEK